MARWVGLFLLLAGLIFALNAGAQERKPEASAAGGGETAVDFGPDYLLGPGDIIDIAVWKDETLTKSVVVLPDGKISFPLIGEIRAAGRTVPQLKQEITKKISPYAPDPIISIEVRQVNSMLVYVIGRVNTPGRFSLNTNINVLQALTMAGGLNSFAKRDKIRIFRREGGKTTIFRFKYDDVTEGSNLEQNIVLQRGDIIVVP
jgi:polysaccharide export outer membrane protein